MNLKRIPGSFFGAATFVYAIAFLSLTVLFAASARAQQPTPVLANIVPSAVASGRAAPVAPLPPTQQLYLSIVLPLRNESQLQELLNQLYDPSSPRYRQFLTVPQFTQMFGPAAEDYNAVVSFAQATGFTVTGTPADRMSVPVQGTVAQIESAFHVKMNLYQHPTENRQFFSLDRQPSLNLSVPVKFISGLDNYSLPHPQLLKGNAQANVDGSGPLIPGGSGSTSYLASDMRAAYYTTTAGATGLTGSGQCVSLVEFDSYYMSGNDVTATLAPQGGPNTATWYTDASGNNYLVTYTTDGVQYSIPLDNVLVDGGTLDEWQNFPAGEPEVVLDIAQAIGMAPSLSQVRVYIAPNETGSEYPILEQMVNDYTAGVGCRQASISWSWNPEDPLNDPDNDEFQEFDAIGISFFAASADEGSWISDTSCYEGACYVYPQESPYVTAVGGTDLTTSGPGGAWQAEGGWDYSGGGISPDHFPMSSYQSGLDGINQTSTVYRNAPDVAMEADSDNYLYYLGGEEIDYTAAGTSFAAPRWAAFTALANQQALASGEPPIGFINPFIYPVGESSNYLTDFNETMGGNNGGYSVVLGEYNMVTGWGSPNGQSLINALSPVTRFTLSASPVSLTLTPGSSETSSYIMVTTHGYATGSTLNLSVSGQPSGVTVSLGENPVNLNYLASEDPMTVNVANNTAYGTYTITVTGTVGGAVLTAYFTLAVAPGAFTISGLPQADQSLTAGTCETVPVSTTAIGNFNAPVTLSSSVSLLDVTSAYSAGNGTVTICATTGATSGLSPITITGTGGGLTVTETWPVYVTNFTFSAFQTSISVAAGSRGTSTVTVNDPNGPDAFPISLSAGGYLPPGTTVSFSPNPVDPEETPTNVTMTVAVPSGTLADNYYITVTGTMEHTLLTQSINVMLVVP
jgi:subtilase family serine protease